MTLKTAINTYYDTSSVRWKIEQKRIYIILLFLNYDYTIDRIGKMAASSSSYVSKIIADRKKYKTQVDAIQGILHSSSSEMV